MAAAISIYQSAIETPRCRRVPQDKFGHPLQLPECSDKSYCQRRWTHPRKLLFECGQRRSVPDLQPASTFSYP